MSDEARFDAGLDTARPRHVPVLVRADLSLSRRQTAREVLEVGYRPRADLPPWPVAGPIDWGADPFGDRNWRSQLQGLRCADAFVVDWYTSGSRDSVQRVLAMMLGWSDYAECHPEREAALWSDMTTGLRAMKLAFLIDVSGRLCFPAATRRRLLELGRQHAERLTDPASRSFSNHGIFQICGAELLTYVRPEARWAARARARALKHLQLLIPLQFTREGVHREHSPAYHLFARRNIGAMQSFRRLDAAQVENYLKRSAKVSPWMVRPDNTTVTIGDSEPAARQPDSARMIKGGVQHGNYIVSTFDQSGYAIVRSSQSTPLSQSSMLFFTGMRWSGSHKHDDDLAIELFEFGRPIIVDGGKYAYKQDKWRAYAKRQVAHSTAGITDDDNRNRDLPPYGSALQAPTFSGGVFDLRGKVEHSTHVHHRAIQYKPREQIVIRDDLRSSHRRNFVSRLLFDQSVIAEQHRKGVTVRLPTGHTAEITCSHPVALYLGAEEPLSGWQTASYGKMVPAPLLEATDTARKSTIQWVARFSTAPPAQHRASWDRVSLAATRSAYPAPSAPAPRAG